MMNVKIHRSTAEINETEWDSIVAEDHIFCRHKYVATLERSGMNKDRCYYPVVYDNGKIVAHAAAYFISTELDLFARGAIRKIVHTVRRKWKNFFMLQSLECGPPIALGKAISFMDGVDRAEALKLLCHAMEKLAKELRINLLLFRDFYDHEGELCDLLKKGGYEKIHNLPKAEIKIRWKSFDDYLNSMRSNYRCKIVKSMEKCARANISIGQLKDLSKYGPRELKKLYDNVYDRAKEVKRERLSEAFFHDIEKHLGEKVVILSAVKDDRLLGYMLLLISGKTVISMFPGLDYDYSKDYYVYFNLFYKTIEFAINKGMDNIDMGITTLDPKKDMGSQIVTLNMYMKHSNPILNRIIPTLFDMITPPDTTGPRNVFKEVSA